MQTKTKHNSFIVFKNKPAARNKKPSVDKQSHKIRLNSMKKILLFLNTFILIATISNAQQDTIKIEEVVIKASKVYETLQKSPGSVSLINKREVQTFKMNTIEELNSMVPNFFIPEHGSRLTSPIYIRGIGSRINSQSVGLYLDDVPYFEMGSFNFELFGIDRIEILRGPQGTLYGRNTMGGLINIYSTPLNASRYTELQTEYGNYNRIKTVLHHNQPISKKLLLSVDGAFSHSDGFFTNTFLNEKADLFNVYSGRIKLQYSPSRALKINFSSSYEKNLENGYPYAVYDIPSQTADSISYNRPSIYHRSLLSSGLHIQYSADKFLFKSVTSHQYLSDLQSVDQDFTPKDLFFVEQNRKHHTVAQEIIFKSKTDSKIKWVGGAFGFIQKRDKHVTVEYGEDAIPMFHLPKGFSKLKNYKQPVAGAAAYAQITVPFNKFSFTAGVRVDYEKDNLDYRYDKNINGNIKNAQQIDTFNTYSQILPKASVAYQIAGATNTYFSVSKGYKAGGFNSTFEREEDISFNPESSINYEWGLKSTLFNNKLSANLALFYIDWKDQQVYQPVPSGHGAMLKNAGKTISKGVEFSLLAKLVSNLQIWLNTGYNNVTFDLYQKDEHTDYSGNKLPYIPEYTVSTGALYTQKLKGKFLKSMNLMANYKITGKFFWNDANTAFQNSYGLLNANVSFNSKNFSFGVYGKNLLNTSYNSYYFEALHKSYVQLGRPMEISGFIKLFF